MTLKDIAKEDSTLSLSNVTRLYATATRQVSAQ